MRLPVPGSLSSSGTKIMLDLKSLATRLPTIPERAMFCFSCSTLCGEPLYESGITAPPRKPSSVTSVQRTAGVHSDLTQARSTPGVEDQLVADLLQRLQVARVEDVAIGVLDYDADRVAQAAQVLLVRQVVLDVRLALRNHLLEARVQREPRRSDVAEHQRDERADDHHRQPVVEHQPFEPVARLAGRSPRDRGPPASVRFRIVTAAMSIVLAGVRGSARSHRGNARHRAARRPQACPPPASAIPVSGIGCRKRHLAERTAAIGCWPRRGRRHRRAAWSPPRCVLRRRPTPAVRRRPWSTSRRGRRCGRRYRAARRRRPQIQRRSHRKSCRCKGRSNARNRCAAASSFSTRPPSPAMNSSPAAGRIA